MEKPNLINTEKYTKKIENSDLGLGNEEREFEYSQAWFRLGKAFNRITREKGKTTIDLGNFSIEEWSSDVRDDPDFGVGVKKLERLIVRDARKKLTFLEHYPGFRVYTTTHFLYN